MARPHGLDAEGWRPPKAPPLEGHYARNDLLAGAELWPALDGQGPEDVALDAGGNAYAGIDDGRILRWPAGGGQAEVIAHTGGRPLGVEADPAGGLIVCDARTGLVRIRDGGVDVLVDTYEGQRLKFTNNADVAADGTIYFSDSSTRWGFDNYREDIAENRPNGRLFAHDPATGQTTLVAAGLYFANGVLLGPGEEHVLVAETGRRRIARIWLQGRKAGTRDWFTENLPGHPDNLSRGRDGTVWVALATAVIPVFEFLLPRPRLRTLTMRLPERLQPQLAPHAFVLALDDHGRVVHNLQDTTGHYYYVTGMREHAGWLYLGSLTHPALARIRI